MKNIKRLTITIFIFTTLVLNTTNTIGGTNPILNIKGNNLVNQITLSPSDTLSLKVDMNPGDLLGTNADWWVVASTPSGSWYSYVYPSGWINIGSDLGQIAVAYQGALFALSPFEVLNIKNLAPGDYNLYFGVDTNMNGLLDYSSLTYNALKIRVSSSNPFDFSGKWSWSGESGINVKQPFSFAVEDGMIISMGYQYSVTTGNYTCSENRGLNSSLNQNAAISNGQFNVDNSYPDRTVKISGLFLSNTEASGSIYIGGQNCGPITLPWNATRKTKLNRPPKVILTKDNVSSVIHKDSSGNITGATVTFKPTVSDADGDSLTCTWRDFTGYGKLVGDCASGTWERPFSYGSYSLNLISISATDGKETVTKNCNFYTNGIEPISCY